ncbi:hypothetical protein [Mycolicibacterium fortuitum]|jgi:hypothetical protein|uniref:hypothetical protein n=1 Tax=Mycolicibacterium fortuitum TaxID=1766 RepID=UPI003AB091A5
MTIGSDSIEIIRRTYEPPDPYGYTAPIETVIPVDGCSFQFKATDEIPDAPNTIASVTAKVYMPVTTDTTALTSQDAIRYNGRTYELRGPSVTTTDLDGNNNHVRALVRWAS